MTPTPHPYPAYQPSGVPWLGDVPEHWEVRRGKALLVPVDIRSATGNEELLTVSSQMGVVPRKSANVTMFKAESYVGYKLCWPGDLVINSLWAWAHGLGVSQHHGIVSSAYGVYRPLPKANAQFIHLLVRSVPFQWELQVRSKGIWVSRLQLTDETFLEAPFPLPPLPEQTAIVRYLDHADRRIRRYVRAKRRLVALLTEERQAVVNRVVTRGLDPNVRLKPSGVGWLGNVPKHWEVRRLKGYVTNAIDLTRALLDGELYLALEHVEGWTGRFSDAGSGVGFSGQAKRFQAEDVLFGKLRPYLAKVTFPKRSGVCVGEFLVLRPQDTRLSPRYLEQLLRSKPVIDTINSSTFGAKMPRADWQFIGDLLFPLPPLTEQTAIVEYLDEATTSIAAAIARACRQIELVEEYRTRLIADVVTGKLDVWAAAAQLPEEADDEADPIDESGPLAENMDVGAGLKPAPRKRARWRHSEQQDLQ